MLKNCLIGQSGGPTAVINASLKGVIDVAKESKYFNNIYGMRYGIQGLLNGQVVDLSQKSSQELRLLKYTPSSVLGTSRYKIVDYNDNDEDYVKLFKLLNELKIGFLFYIGGNDSMDTVYKLNRYAKEKGIDIKIIGIPKTVDNDLLETDHCPGYGSASKYIATSVMEIARDSRVYDIKNVHIVEVMGRESGWLAASSMLASNDKLSTPDYIYVPEIEFSINKFIKDIERKMKEQKAVVVVVSEGIKDKHNNYISVGKSTTHDHFGHKKLGGAAPMLAPFIKGNLCDRVKAIKLDVMQRAAAHCVSKRDAEEAYILGVKAAEAAIEGKTGTMISIKRLSSNPYKVEYIETPVGNIANKVKVLPNKYIEEDKNQINEKYKDYVLPLIKGEVNICYKDGLPQYAELDCLNNGILINS